MSVEDILEGHRRTKKLLSLMGMTADSGWLEFIAELEAVGRSAYADEILERCKVYIDANALGSMAVHLGLQTGPCALYDSRDLLLLLGKATVSRERVCEYMEIDPLTCYDSDWTPSDDIRYGLSVRDRYLCVGPESFVELSKLLSDLRSKWFRSDELYVKLMDAYKCGCLDL